MGTPTPTELSGWLSPKLISEKKGYIPIYVIPREVERQALRMSGEAACFAASRWQEEKLKSSYALSPCLQHLLACSFPERRFPTELHVRLILRTCLMAQKSWGMLWQCSVCTVRKIVFCSLDSNVQHKTPLLLMRFLPGFLWRCSLAIRTFYPEFALWEDTNTSLRTSFKECTSGISIGQRLD